jgi:hypothetical protein
MVITPIFFAKGRAGSHSASEYVCLPDINQRYNETVREARSRVKELNPVSSYLLQYQEWTELLPSCNGLLLLQTGHWWWMEQKNASFYERMVTSVLDYVSQNFHGVVIYFTSSRGHTDFTKAGAPLLKYPPAIAPEMDEFRWMLPESLDHYWLDIASTMESLRGRFYVINTSATILRPDAHRRSCNSTTGDGLHYCTPGLPHFFTELLYNLLLQLSSEGSPINR